MGDLINALALSIFVLLALYLSFSDTALCHRDLFVAGKLLICLVCNAECSIHASRHLLFPMEMSKLVSSLTIEKIFTIEKVLAIEKDQH